jgi:outer membrane protein TolC
MKTDSCIGSCSHAVMAVVFLLLPASVLAEPVTLRQTVELALKHATSAAMAADDVLHASAAYRELHNSYIPQVTIGAGLGWSY